MRRCSILALLVVAGVVGWHETADAQWTWTPQIGRFVNAKRLPKETPELQVEYARSLMLQGEYKKALYETNKFSNFYADTDWADDNQFLRGEIRLAQDDYSAAAREFQMVIDGYPGTDLFDQVIQKQYEIGDEYFALGEANAGKGWWHPWRKRPYKKAAEIYNMVIKNQPFALAAAEAQYKVGLCHHIREEYIEAAYEYRQVVDSYASSDWVDDAIYGLAHCYYDSSLEPDYDQVPCQLAINAIDDFKSLFPNDERVAELDTIRGEMRESIAAQRLKTAQFYEKRRKFEAARICYQVIVDEFADTSVAQTANAWLGGNT